jgi:hypothetical protein
VFFYFPTREVLVDAVLGGRFLPDRDGQGSARHAEAANVVLLDHLHAFAAW